MNKKHKLYFLFTISMIVMPLVVLFTEKYFEYFILLLLFPPIIFILIIYLYLRNQEQILPEGICYYILLINLFNNIIICYAGAFLFTGLGMAHYDGPESTTLTDISFFSWFIGIIFIIFIILLYMMVRPFVNHLDKSIRKIKEQKENKNI